MKTPYLFPARSRADMTAAIMRLAWNARRRAFAFDVKAHGADLDAHALTEPTLALAAEYGITITTDDVQEAYDDFPAYWLETLAFEDAARAVSEDGRTFTDAYRLDPVTGEDFGLTMRWDGRSGGYVVWDTFYGQPADYGQGPVSWDDMNEDEIRALLLGETDVYGNRKGHGGGDFAPEWALSFADVRRLYRAAVVHAADFTRVAAEREVEHAAAFILMSAAERVAEERAGQVDAAHDWHAGRFTGAVTCARCGLLPLDEEDAETPCPA